MFRSSSKSLVVVVAELMLPPMHSQFCSKASFLLSNCAILLIASSSKVSQDEVALSNSNVADDISTRDNSTDRQITTAMKTAICVFIVQVKLRGLSSSFSKTVWTLHTLFLPLLV
uniref:Uncharacterized protein n=1 Tax=Octactis speculum TaxID=3111310 RepID=A0A7S2BYQ5_9STRA